MSAPPAEAPPISVVVAIVASDPQELAVTIAAVRQQVYEPAMLLVVGADSEGRHAADAAGAAWVSSIGNLIAGLDPRVTHVWLIHGGTVPRPDALGSLVHESERVEAGIAGSKLLSAEHPDRLISVGMATDVFDAPYTGLDEGEIDAGQYDVLRDVAAVGGASVLVRRDLVRGLRGPDPLMAPGAAAIDLCQRARLRGGRVVVVPTSEVLVPERPREGWREEAGQIRSMLKVYSLLTLVWAVPLRFLIGLLEAIVAPFVGRWTLFGWIRAWFWNLFHLPSTISGRRNARQHRAVGDTELFRFQLRGSASMRRLSGELGEVLRDRLPGDDRISLTEIGRELRQPAFIVGALALAFSLVSVRTLWRGFPAVGYSLPLPASGPDLVGAYAGAWNPGGFGSVEPLPPFLGLAGVVQTALFGNGAVASWALIVGAFIAGTWGTTRLLRTWQVEAVAGAAAGLVLMAGPAARAIAADTGLGTLVALGVLPWALRVPLARWPATRWAQIGRVAAAGWVAALMALGAPLLVMAPPAALILLALITPREPGPWRAVAVSLAGSALAIPVLMPWVSTVDLAAYVAAGEAFWEPGLLLAAALGIALLFSVITAPRRLAQIAGWGGVIAAAGGLLARTGDLGPGREVQLAAMAIASLGVAVVVGVSLELISQVRIVTGWRRLLAGIGFVGAAAVAVSVVLVLLPGRAGLPADQLDDAIGFTGAADGDPHSSRILLVGSEDELPGESRSVLGAPYRVVSAPIPALWEAWLPEPRSSDAALDSVLVELIGGESFRAGADLAAFGIRWVIFLGDSPLESVFVGQLDLVPLEGLATPAFVSEAEVPVRAVASDGTAWTRTSTGYAGTADANARVRLAESANSRWGSNWEQVDWANEVDAADGSIEFAAIGSRRSQAFLAAAIFAALVALSWWGRRRR
ncbi:MAG TPA: glycosyltransferase [Acidimicrobiia bacterium]|nr:glycosyltransferase [Acidimicrobiia bacterium]